LISLPLSKYRRKRILVSGSLHNDSSVVIVSVGLVPVPGVVPVFEEEEKEAEGTVNSRGRRRPEMREARIEGLTS
jgi:hypothetical protein